MRRNPPLPAQSGSLTCMGGTPPSCTDRPKPPLRLSSSSIARKSSTRRAKGTACGAVRRMAAREAGLEPSPARDCRGVGLMDAIRGLRS